MTTLLFQITFAPHGLEEKLGIVFFNIKSRSHNEISGFLKISSYEMCAIGITYFRKLDNSEQSRFQHNHVSPVKGHIIHVTEIYEMGLTSLV